MAAYYNENDPQAAAWLRELIARGMLPAGDVDDRSIKDVCPDDLRPYIQCHFFAGIGGWPAALKWLAGWPDDRPVWTGSCPCQPFSAAGKGKGFDDERHLWPDWFHLIRVCRPGALFGEQVDKALAWIDLIQDDLEGEGYAFGAADLCAASVASPHIRQRLFWGAYDLGFASVGVAHTDRAGLGEGRSGERAAGRDGDGGDGAATRVDDAQRAGPQGHDWDGDRDRGRSDAPRSDAPASGHLGLAHADGTTGQQVSGGASGDEGTHGGGADGTDGHPGGGQADRLAHADGTVSEQSAGAGTGSDAAPGAGAYRELDGCGELPSGRVGTSPIGGWWSGSDWCFGRDGKFRPVETGSFPLGDGIPDRVGLLRGYGNAIVPQVAAEFVKAFEESR